MLTCLMIISNATQEALIPIRLQNLIEKRIETQLNSSWKDVESHFEVSSVFREPCVKVGTLHYRGSQIVLEGEIFPLKKLKYESSIEDLLDGKSSDLKTLIAETAPQTQNNINSSIITPEMKLQLDQEKPKMQWAPYALVGASLLGLYYLGTHYRDDSSSNNQEKQGVKIKLGVGF